MYVIQKYTYILGEKKIYLNQKSFFSILLLKRYCLKNIANPSYSIIEIQNLKFNIHKLYKIELYKIERYKKSWDAIKFETLDLDR